MNLQLDYIAKREVFQSMSCQIEAAENGSGGNQDPHFFSREKQ